MGDGGGVGGRGGASGVRSEMNQWRRIWSVMTVTRRETEEMARVAAVIVDIMAVQ